jgi:hypothetical protein
VTWNRTKEHQVRRAAATTLLIFGVVLIVICGATVYFGRALLDRDAFAARLVAALDRPHASAFVAEQITDRLVAAKPDLIGVRPLIISIAESTVRSSAFEALALRGARNAHHLVVSEGAEQLLLSIPDVHILLRGALAAIDPEITRSLPEEEQPIVETRLSDTVPGLVVTLLQDAARIRLLARIGLVLGILLVVAGVAVAPARRQALLNVGIATLTVAAILALIVPLGHSLVTSAVAEASLSGALGDVWIAFAGELRSWSIGLALVALTLVAAATASRENRSLLESPWRELGTVGRRQPTRGREAFRILLLTVLGVLAVVEPIKTLEATMVVAGGLVFLGAVGALVDLVAPRRESRASGTDPLHLNPALSIGIGCVIAIVVLLGGSSVALRVGPQLDRYAAGAAMECNGDERLCGRRLDEITLAGAHNAMGSAEDVRWMFPNQDESILGLLRLGIRAFMLDVWYGNAVEDRVKTAFESEEQRKKFEDVIGPEAFAAAMRIRDRLIGEGGPTGMYMCHGFCEIGAVPFDSALTSFKTFLVENPNEVLLLILEDYVSSEDVAAAFERQGLLDYLYEGPPGGPYPTLREMISSGNRLFVMAEHDAGEIPWYFPAYDEVLQETPYTFHAPEEFSCAPNRGAAENPLFLVNHWIETTPAPRPTNAGLVNTDSALVSRARECERQRGRRANVIAVDFAGVGDVVEATAILNGLVESEAGP